MSECRRHIIGESDLQGIDRVQMRLLWRQRNREDRENEFPAIIKTFNYLKQKVGPFFFFRQPISVRIAGRTDIRRELIQSITTNILPLELFRANANCSNCHSKLTKQACVMSMLITQHVIKRASPHTHTHIHMVLFWSLSWSHSYEFIYVLWLMARSLSPCAGVHIHLAQ